MFKDVIFESASRSKSRVVIALDFTSKVKTRLSSSMRTLQEVSDYVAAVKLNYHLILPYGLKGISGLVEFCNKKGLPVIADLKLNDIHSTNKEVYRLLRYFGFGGVIVNPIVGYKEGMDALLRKDRGGFGVIFLVMTSNKGSDEFYGMDLDSRKLYHIFAEKAKAWKADGVIVSAKNTEAIRETRRIVGKDCIIFTPGVGAQGGDAEAAVSAGADFIIAGRAIIKSDNRINEIKKLNSVFQRF